MSDDELEYLAPGFDPSTLTVPRIRSILVSHDVPYPASAKKPQLVDTFKDQITPKASRIRAARDRIRRTSRGITDMPSSQESTVEEDGPNDAELMPPPPPPSTAKRRTKKSVQPSVEADATPVAPKASPRKRSTKHPRASDSEAGGDVDNVQPTSRKARRSEAPPAVHVEESEPAQPARRPKLEESPFSDENPFQRGSSSPLLAPATEPRRRTTGTKTDKKRAVSNRRRTDQPVRVKQEDGYVVPSSRTFEVPVSRVNAMVKSEPEDPLDAGEEFTPEEEQALAQERDAEDRAAPRHARPKPKGSALKSAPWVILTTLLAGYAAWWRKEAVEVGYCGVGKPAVTLSEMQLPDWASALQPQCQPCPLHGTCYTGMEVRCDHDFILKHHPLSLGGLVPLPPTCEPDSEKQRKVQTVANRAVEELRDRRAKWECGELTDKTGKVMLSPEIDEVKLKAEVSLKRRRAMSDVEFEELWRAALPEIQAREEVTSNVDGITRRAHLSSSSLAKLPLGCALRRSARLALARYRVALIILSLGLGLAAYLRHLVLRGRADRARVPALVAGTLDRLATQAARHAQGTAPEPWISAGQLRDDVLRDEFSADRREEIWARVRKVVEMNANVRASVREGRTGEVSRVWEWIGSVQDLEDGRGANGAGPWVRRSASPAKRDSPAPGGVGTELVEKRKWDEGRPIY